ncbi:BPSS1780 family membrane protein [Marilutibacter alkalisoli]|uniref:DUF2189 domain-containing protein n=1 Tax=Marilutibacter alkalisoli TaxID=2591633 RepID=A0A514BW27_9GAMM|nr:BPSS1780 family membrane protein [Lysobacter alkalisoli]QDH71515.1 hypothetical protein FKV23_16510 [Lysobacter alkalisoli]
MPHINKLSASQGAQWLLDGFTLLRKAPLALGVLGLIWGGLSAIASLTGQVWMSLVLAVFGPLLFGGVIYAAREVDQGRSAQPGHLLQGLREGKMARFLVMLLPQLAALLVLALLLVAMIGSEQLQQMAEVMQKIQDSAGNPDPALLEALPVGSLFAWLVAVLVVSMVAGFFTLIAIPDVMFTDRSGFAAMGLSFRACLHNIGAVLVFMVLLVITFFALSIAANILVAVLGIALGLPIAMLIGQTLLMSVLLPLMGATIYSAWRRMLDGTAPPPMPSAGIEV